MFSMGRLQALPYGSPEVLVSRARSEGAGPVIGGGSTGGLSSNCVFVNTLSIGGTSISKSIDSEPHP